MQAIHVKFLGPTNVRGSRYKAICAAGSLTLHSDHALNPSDNARRVAEALRDKLGWNTPPYGDLIEGGLPDGSYVFVFAAQPAIVDALADVQNRLYALANSDPDAARRIELMAIHSAVGGVVYDTMPKA